ncbi:MAG: hypothetical protein RI560_09155 [Natronomonas sp.]|nr:hypothetical protein [Natronomonas sp.]
MSVEQQIADVATGDDPAGKRTLLNPWDSETPSTLLDAANEICRGYMRDERDGYHLLGDHHGEWLRLLDENRKLVLNCHRDGLKTTIVLCYLALRLEYDDGFRAIWAMNNKTMAKKKTDLEFNRVVERNPWLTNLQKADRVTDTIDLKEFPNGATLTATWLDGGVDGDRAHLLVLDDLIKARGDGNPKDVREWVEGTATPMVKDNGRSVMIGTRKRQDDLYQHYRSLPAYSVAEFPAVLDYWEASNGTADDVDDRRPPERFYTTVEDPWQGGEMQVLWPEARGSEWLAEKRDEMADFRFWREYCLSFIGASGNLISADDVNLRVEDGGCSIRGASPPRKYRAGANEAIVVAHDPAQSPTGDDAAFVVFRAKADGTRTLLDARAGQGLQPSQIKAQLAEYDRRFDPAVIGIEDNGMQQYVVNDAIEFSPQLASKVVGFSTTGKKHSWENGIPRLRTLVENGAIQFYRGHQPSEEFVQAAMSLELSDGKLQGHTPDLVAAWYIAERAMRRLRFGGAGDDDNTDSGVSYA